MIPIRDDAPRSTTPFITYFLIILNLAVFLYERAILGFQGHAALSALLFEFGVVPRVETAILTGNTELSPALAIIPLFTSMFLHGGWLHVIGNMWFLWIFGDNIEAYLGHFKYLILYLFSGLAASLLHILFNLNSGVPSVGASGAIAGVMGAYFVLYPRARVLTLVPLIVFWTFWWLPAWIFLAYWFVIQFLSGAATAISATSQTGGIAFWAHVGGFAGGILMIKIFPPRRQRYSYGTW
jgi:membrane associated rhomboid family serine protease